MWTVKMDNVICHLHLNNEASEVGKHQYKLYSRLPSAYLEKLIPEELRVIRSGNPIGYELEEFIYRSIVDKLIYDPLCWTFAYQEWENDVYNRKLRNGHELFRYLVCLNQQFQFQPITFERGLNEQGFIYLRTVFLSLFHLNHQAFCRDCVEVSKEDLLISLSTDQIIAYKNYQDKADQIYFCNWSEGSFYCLAQEYEPIVFFRFH